MMNLVQPTVVRQYFGLQVPDSNIRCTFPLMESLGNVRNKIDQHNFVTRAMCPYMMDNSKKLHEMTFKKS